MSCVAIASCVCPWPGSSSRSSRRAAGGRRRSPARTPASPVAGNAVVQGTVTGASAGLQVGVVGTPLVAPVDEEGQFALAGVPRGTATLRFEGSGIDARVPVPGLQDGLVTSVTVHLSGGTAQLSGTPSCTPTAETFFSGHDRLDRRPPARRGRAGGGREPDQEGVARGAAHPALRAAGRARR